MVAENGNGAESAPKKQGLFVIGSDNFERALELGLYPALAYLVLARGTGRDHTTTRWRAKSVKDRCRIRWRKAQEAIDALAEAGLVEVPEQTKERTWPPLRLAEPEGQEVFLPNSLVDGAGEPNPPLTRIRETQDPEVLGLLIRIYQHQNLADEHGICRDWIWSAGDVEAITDSREFNIWAGYREGMDYMRWGNPLSEPFKPDADEFWKRFRVLERLGLVESVWYVTDSGGELLFPLDEEVDDAGHDWVEGQELNSCMGYPDASFLFTTYQHQAEPGIVGIYRTRYRTHTKMTGEWWQAYSTMKSEALRRYEIR